MKRSDSEMSDMSDMPGMRLDANLLVNEGRDFIEFDSPWKNGGGGRLSGSEGGDGSHEAKLGQRGVRPAGAAAAARA